MSNLIPSLKDFGLTENEAKVYLANLELGSATVQEVAKKSGVKRTTIYTMLENLKRYGLMSEFHKQGKILLIAEDPSRLEQLMQNRQERIKAALPELRSLFSSPAEKPKVRFYEGKDGIRQVFQDTLDEGKEIKCFVSWRSELRAIPEIVNAYIKERVKKDIWVRALADRTKESKYYQERGKEELRELYFLPEGSLPFDTEVNIYGNKVAWFTFKKEYFGLIIESEQIANTWRMVFDIIWGMCKNSSIV
jgi:sugar-specific transcriptional regulator TrmB